MLTPQARYAAPRQRGTALRQQAQHRELCHLD
jgi:hypothetical protein